MMGLRILSPWLYADDHFMERVKSCALLVCIFVCQVLGRQHVHSEIAVVLTVPSPVDVIVALSVGTVADKCMAKDRAGLGKAGVYDRSAGCQFCVNQPQPLVIGVIPVVTMGDALVITKLIIECRSYVYGCGSAGCAVEHFDADASMQQQC